LFIGFLNLQFNPTKNAIRNNACTAEVIQLLGLMLLGNILLPLVQKYEFADRRRYTRSVINLVK